VFEGIVLLIALLLSLWGLVFAVRLTVVTVRRFRRCRYSLGEFLVLILGTGLAMGLTAKALPEGTLLAVVMAVSLGVGFFVIWGGAAGIYTAQWLGEELPRERILYILRGLFLAPALAFAVGAPLGIPMAIGLALAGRPPHAFFLLLCTALGAANAIVGLTDLLEAKDTEMRNRGIDLSRGRDTRPPAAGERSDAAVDAETALRSWRGIDGK